MDCDKTIMFHYLTRTSLFITLTAFIFCAGLSQARAQVMAPAGALADIPTFQIVDGWTVAKTPLSQAMKFDDMRLPCVMTAGFDNGFSLRFSGGGGKVMALAIDFRQEIFRQGRKYNTLITTDIAQHNVSATAFSENILLFKIKDANGFYQSVMRDAPIIVDVEGNTFRFMMSGIMEGMTQLEQCYDPQGGPVMAFPIAGPMPPMEAPAEPGSPMGVAAAPSLTPVPVAPGQPLPQAMPQPVPMGVPALPEGGPVPITPDAPAPMAPEVPPTPAMAAAPPAPTVTAVPPEPQPILAQVEPVKNYPEWGSRVSKAAPHDKRDERRVMAEPSNKLPTKQMDMPIQEQLWTAKDGDSVEATVRRWAGRAKVDVAWQAGPPVPVMGDFEFRGTFNEAVQALIAQNASTMGFVAQMDPLVPAGMAPAPMPVPMDAAPVALAPVGPMVSPAPMMPEALPRVSKVVPTVPPTAMPQPITPVGPSMMSPVISSAPLPPPPANVPPPSTVEYVPFKWSAPSGASLQGVLEFWSKQAGVDFVWQSNQNFELKRGINNTQSYESALQSVLEQFAMEGVYPTAQLNKDPKTGRETLFVFSARKG